MVEPRTTHKSLRTSCQACSVRSSSLLSDWTTGQGGEEEFRSSFALAHYNESIGLVVKGLLWQQQSKQTTLVLCLLFISIELLQNDIDLALDHLCAGIRILTALESSPSDSVVGSCLSHTLRRFEAQSRVYSCPTSHFQ